MDIIGHRGCEAHAPENTVAAVEHAAAEVDLVEVDVRRCGSGELVCAHDEGLERTTGYGGDVSQTPWDRLRELDVQGSGEPIPRFDTLLDACPSGIGLNVDIKDADAAADVFAALEGQQVTPVIVSVGPDTLADRSDSVDPMLGLTVEGDPEVGIARALDHGYDYLHVLFSLCFGTEIVDLAHEADLAVDAWSVGDRETLRRLEEAGVDAVTVTACDID
ncbi:MAG: glycerophosphodiester phosphodiesterase [Halobacteriales archaeon]